MSASHLAYCAALDAEIRALVAAGEIAAELRPVDAGLCLEPPALGRALRQQLAASLGHPVALVYGQCFPGIDDLAARYRAERVSASNCMEMLLGEAEYIREVAAGSFFLLPQWVGQWQTVFQDRLGLTPEVAPELLRDELRGVVYLDTGIATLAAEALDSFASYSGLAVARRPVALDHLAHLLRTALTRAAGGRSDCRGALVPSARSRRAGIDTADCRGCGS